MSHAAKRFELHNLDYYESREMQGQFKDPELARFKEMQQNCVDNGYLSSDTESDHSGFDSGGEDEYVRETNHISPPEINYIDILEQESCERVLDQCIARQPLPVSCKDIPDEINVDRLHETLADMTGSSWLKKR
jgi:hypothetical protein